MGVKPEKVVVITPGIDIEAIASVLPHSEETDLLFAGRLIKDKHVDNLLEVVARLRADHHAIQCTIVGDGPERSALEDQAEELGLGKNIRFTGFLPKVDELYARMKSAKLLVFLSEREGFGMVVVESAACGLPSIVVSAENNAAATLVVDGKTGFVCPPDYGRIAGRISALLKDPEQRLGMSLNAQSWSKQFDWEYITKKIESVYIESAKLVF